MVSSRRSDRVASPRSSQHAIGRMSFLFGLMIILIAPFTIITTTKFVLHHKDMLHVTRHHKELTGRFTRNGNVGDVDIGSTTKVVKKNNNTLQSGTGPRIIFAVPTPWPLNTITKDNLVATISTWGSHATRLILIVSQQQIERYPPDSELGDEHSQIKNYLYAVKMERADGVKGGRHIWEKMWRGWRLVADRFRMDAEFFVKADLDTFVAVENMRAFLSYVDPGKPYYFGHTLFHEWKRYNLVFNSGTCYILSREALRRLNIRLRSLGKRQKVYECGDGPGAGEDPHTSSCLRDMGVLATDSLDSKGRQRFLTFRPKDHLFAMRGEDSWYWRYKDKTKDLLECCSTYPISFHNFKSKAGVYDAEAYYRLEYYLSSKPYEVVREAIDPPWNGGQWFRLHESIDFAIDKDRNNINAKPHRKLGRWLTQNPHAWACVNKTASCYCQLPESLPHLGNGVTLDSTDDPNCKLGGRLKLGGRCPVICEKDYIRQESTKTKGTSYLSCPDGALLFPKPLGCKVKCSEKALEALRLEAKSFGGEVQDTPLSGTKLRCGEGRSLANGKISGRIYCRNGIECNTDQYGRV